MVRIKLVKTVPVKRAVTPRKIIFSLALILCLTPWVSPPAAMVIGIVVAQCIGNPFSQLNHQVTTFLLQISVVGLGFGMNAHTAFVTGKQSFFFTAVSVTATLALGMVLKDVFRIDKKTSYLISSGTAICGGSAIAAIAPAIHAGKQQISVALSIIFMLNAIALFTFPAIGHQLQLTQNQFGLWAAVAIHDTSAVVGAANDYGKEALQVATTVKLVRALWIVPVALITAVVFRSGGHKIKVPWYIGLFILVVIINTYVPVAGLIAPYLITLARTGMTLALFLIGTGLSRDAFKVIGWKPLLQGIVLWLIISLGSLYVIVRISE